MKNILITSAGRRVKLVQLFQKEIKLIDKNSKVFAADLVPELSSACQIADECFKVSRVSSAHYIDEIVKICTENNVKLVIPTIDTELLVFAENLKMFQSLGIEVLISEIAFIELCRDKRKTNMFFVDKGISIPKMYNKDSLQFPLFIKPYDGSSSVGIMTILTDQHIDSSVLDNPKNIFMEWIDKKEYNEYTADLYYNKKGKLICVVPRLRLEIRAGEISKGKTVKNKIVKILSDKLSSISELRGVVALQIFYNEETNALLGIEINPRFGGGFPLSYASGANYIQWIIEEYINEKEIDEPFFNWEENVIMLRYDDDIIVRDCKSK